jgi:hypothetical protein
VLITKCEKLLIIIYDLSLRALVSTVSNPQSKQSHVLSTENIGFTDVDSMG